MDPDNLPYIVIGFIALALGVCFFVAFRMQKAGRAQLGQFLVSLGGSPGATDGRAVHDGIPFQFRFTAGGISPADQALSIGDIVMRLWGERGSITPSRHGPPPSLTVEVESQTPGTFLLRREGGADRFAKRVGLGEDAMTHDPRFDEEFFVQTDTPAWTEEFLSADRREIVSTLFALGVKRVEHDGQVFRAVWEPFGAGLEKGLDPAPYRQAIARLAELSRGPMPQPARAASAVSAPATASPGSRAPRPATRSKISLFIVLGTTYALGFLAVFTFVFGKMWFPPVSTSATAMLAVICGVVALLLGAGVLWSVGRKCRWTGAQLLGAGISTIVIVPFLGAGIGIFLNGWLDSSAETPHTVLVRNRQIVKTKEGPTYIAMVESWYQAGSLEEIAISKSDYDWILPSYTRMTVKTRRGALGLEWSRGYALQLIDPTDAAGYLRRGRAAMAEGLHDQAAADLTKAIELSPTATEAYRNLDRLLTKRGQWDAIIGHWSKLIALQPENAEAYLERGGAYFQKGDRAASVRDAEKACQLGNQQGCLMVAKYGSKSQ